MASFDLSFLRVCLQGIIVYFMYNTRNLQWFILFVSVLCFALLYWHTFYFCMLLVWGEFLCWNLGVMSRELSLWSWVSMRKMLVEVTFSLSIFIKVTTQWWFMKIIKSLNLINSEQKTLIFKAPKKDGYIIYSFCRTRPELQLGAFVSDCLWIMQLLTLGKLFGEKCKNSSPMFLIYI